MARGEVLASSYKYRQYWRKFVHSCVIAAGASIPTNPMMHIPPILYSSYVCTRQYFIFQTKRKHKTHPVQKMHFSHIFSHATSLKFCIAPRNFLVLKF